MFIDRVDAGKQLASLVRARLRADENPIVLALPRGGVPVAAEVATALGAPLDVLIVRKLGMPFDPEFAFGAISVGGAKFVDRAVVARARLNQSQIDEVVSQEQAELERRQQVYRAGKPGLNLAGRTVVLVDDGIATGATVKAAIAAVRALGAARLVLAVPVCPAESVAEFANLVNEFVCVLTPENLQSVGQWYQRFEQVSDAEVLRLLV